MKLSDRYLKDKHFHNAREKLAAQNYAALRIQEELEANIKGVKQSITNLQKKHDSFLGTEGQQARTDFKLGLSWGIESLKNVLATLKENNNE